MIARILLCLRGLLLLALLFLPACQPASSNAVTVGKDAAGTAVSLKTGQELLVRLESNVTTGFSWAVVEGDDNLLALQGDPEYLTSDQDRNRAGAGGFEVFHFKPVKAGTVHLKLAYRRPWETGVEPAETYELDVNIQ